MARYTRKNSSRRRAKKVLARWAKNCAPIEDADPEGRKFPRFKKSDDATAVLLKLT